MELSQNVTQTNEIFPFTFKSCCNIYRNFTSQLDNDNIILFIVRKHVSLQ